MNGKAVCQSREKCEFCAEFQGLDQPENRFRNFYGPTASRILARQSGFVVLPTIGQIFDGSLLVLPENHVERFADLTLSQLSDAFQLLSKVADQVAKFGVPLLFEHGATSQSGGSCGVYHAHIHLVPLPAPRGATCVDMMPTSSFKTHSSLLDAYESLRDCSEYLLVQDHTGLVATMTINAALKPLVPSQYCRQRIHSLFKPQRSWNWRESKTEPQMQKIIERMTVTYATV